MKKEYLNFTFSIAYQIVNLLVGFFVPMYFLGFYGSAYNGLNSSISQVTSLLSVLQFGIATSAIQQMFKYIAKKDEDCITRLFRDSGKEYARMGVYFVLCFLPIAFIFPLFIKSNISYWIIFIFLIIRAISSCVDYFVLAKYGIVFSAHNQSYFIYIANIALLLISTACHLTLIFTKQSIILYQSVALFASLLRCVIYRIYAKKKFPFLFNKNIGTQTLFSKNTKIDVLVSEIAGLVIDSTDLIVLSVFASLVQASVYSIYLMVVASISNVMGSFREAVFAGVGKTYSENKQLFKEKMNKVESLYLTLTFVLYSITIVLYSSFIRAYTSKLPDSSEYLLAGLPILFIMMKLLVNLRIPSIIMINTAGHFKQVKYYAVIEAVINLVVSVVLVIFFGIYGVVIGSIVGCLFRTPVLIWYSSKFIKGESCRKYWRKILVRTPIFVGCYIFSLIYSPTISLAQWVLYACVVFVALVVIWLVWMLIFDKYTFSILKGIFKKKKIKRGL